MAAVAKAAPTSKFDLSCRPLFAQRTYTTADTRDVRTNLMSRFVWSSVVGSVRSTFDDYRYVVTGTTFIPYDQQYSMIPGTKGQSTFHLIRHRYVPGTCM